MGNTIKKLLTVFFVSSVITGTAVAQQEYFTPRQNTFVYGGMWFRQTGDATAEVCENAFQGMTAPDTLVIPSTVQDSTGITFTVTAIGSHAFDYSNALSISHVTLPETLREIGESAFASNNSMQNVILPAGLRRIEDYAFGNQIRGVVTLPDSLEYVSPVAFYNRYNNITGYQIAGSPRYCTIDGILYNRDSTVLVAAPYLALDTFFTPQHVRCLDNKSLVMCGANHVVLNSGLREIGIDALPSQVTNITIPSSVTHIKGRICTSGASLSIIVDSGGMHYKTVDNMLLSFYGDTLVMGFGTWFGTKSLPEGIRVICPYAFAYITTLDRLALPTTVEEIGDGAFLNTVCSIEFAGSLHKVGTWILAGNRGVTRFNVPNTMTEIADYALAESMIDTIVFGDSLRVIPRGILHGCSNLKKITLGRYVEHIMPEAFEAGYGSGALKVNDDYMPETLRTIGRDAFSGRIIQRIRFRSNPDTVGEHAFDQLLRVFFLDTIPPVVYEGAFSSTCDVYVPCHGTAIFSASNGWGPSFHYLESPCPPTAVDSPDEAMPFDIATTGTTLTITRHEPAEMSIYDVTGRRLCHSPCATGAVTFKAPTTGLYLLSVQTSCGTKTYKLSVTH